MAKQYTLGRGELSFGTTMSVTQYFGTTPEFNLTIESENLDHYDSDHGIREKDDSVPLETNRTGSFITDDIQLKTVAIFFFGSYDLKEQAAVAINTGSEEVITGCGPRSRIQLGVTAGRPQGFRGIDPTGFAVYGTGGTPTYAAGTDYILHSASGTVLIPDDSTIPEDTTLEFEYAVLNTEYPEVLSGATPRGGAMRFVSYNPKGQKVDYAFPKVNLRPNGDYSLKGDDWQQIPFTVEILKLDETTAAIYANGEPVDLS